MDLYLVRHGESTGNIVDYDVPDGPLTPWGKTQAQLVGRHLQTAGLTHVISSPLLRALETAIAIASASDLEITVFKETYEWRKIGRYVGPSLEQLRAAFPLARFSDDMEPEGWVCEGVETEAQAYQRAERMRVRLLDEFGDDAVVALVGHGGFNRMFLAACLGIPAPLKVHFRQANVCVNRLRFSGSDVIVASINETAHLQDELQERTG